MHDRVLRRARPRHRELTYSSAGHPPGILVHPDGTVRLLEEGCALPLAVRPGRTRPEATCSLPARATLLLYTDGLVERRRLPSAPASSGRATPCGRAATCPSRTSQAR
ncbi:PP2C family protein-serine/threonine phosphatase [Streptomyces thermocarboxydus]